tara:strand:- start:8442 stop:9539 length:1098 start_codon:yes stop_codon:yes gene_type:complete
MKNILLTLITFIFIGVNSDLQAQNNLGKTDDVGRIAIKTIMPNIPDMPSGAERILLTRMTQIASKNGLASYGSRFIMYPRVDILTQDVIASAPPKHAYTLNVSLRIADNMTRTIYSTTDITLKGVGNNETKAYISALKGLSYRHRDVKDFIEEGKTKIIEFYNSQCDFIIKEAESLAGKKEYDRAIYTLITIPSICKDCYMKGQDASVEVYKQKMENECMQNIADARAAKAKDNYDLAASYLSGILPDVSCYADAQALLKEIEDHRCAVALGRAKGAWASQNAREAGRWLGQVATDSKCNKEATALGNQIKAKLKADEDREWDFILKVQQDQVTLEKEAIKAIRDVGVAWGENQQPTNVNWVNMD